MNKRPFKNLECQSDDLPDNWIFQSSKLKSCVCFSLTGLVISSGQWTYVLIKMLINSNSHKENQIIQQLTTLILCNLSFLLFQTIQYAQFFCLKSQKIPINSYFQVLCAVIAHYTTAVSVINEQRVACDAFALERCCFQLTYSPRDAHPRGAFFTL